MEDFYDIFEDFEHERITTEQVEALEQVRYRIQSFQAFQLISTPEPKNMAQVHG